MLRNGGGHNGEREQHRVSPFVGVDEIIVVPLADQTAAGVVCGPWGRRVLISRRARIDPCALAVHVVKHLGDDERDDAAVAWCRADACSMAAYVLPSAAPPLDTLASPA